MTEEPNLRVISLGAGVQSSAMYWLADAGVIGPKPDFCVFADTQQEPPWVMESIRYMQKNGSIPIRIGTAGDISEALRVGLSLSGGRFAAVPFWSEVDGKRAPGARQCTRDYKIDVIKREIRAALGLKKGERAAGRFMVEQWIGISLDEAHRAKPSRDKWMKHRWPLLLDKPMRRQQCIDWMVAEGHPTPRKSSCIMCPYRQTIEYARWREEEPELFQRAVEFDDLIRSSGSGTMRGMKRQQFVSQLLVPLRDIPTVKELEGEPSQQIDLFGNECEGMCGV